MEYAEFCLRLLMIKGINKTNIRNFLQNNSTKKEYHYQDLLPLSLTKEQLNNFLYPNQKNLYNALNWLQQPSNYFVSFTNEFYPQQLMHIEHAPLFLLVKGNIKALSYSQIAIVGSRICTYYAEECARRFAFELSQTGFTVISGLAVGIDAAAHLGALNAAGTTIAVLGSGPDIIYPKKHLHLAAQILEQEGALISEFLPGMPPLAKNFPRRNRVLSGLSSALLIVEASLHSGSLITANYAIEQGKDVFVIPGQIIGGNNQGGHWLIQQGAYLVTQTAELLQQLQSSFNWIKLPKIQEQLTHPNNIQSKLDFSTDNILLKLLNHNAMPIDVIANKTDYSIAALMEQLLELEIAGSIRLVEGGYIRVKN